VPQGSVLPLTKCLPLPAAQTEPYISTMVTLRTVVRERSVTWMQQQQERGTHARDQTILSTNGCSGMSGHNVIYNKFV